MCRCKSWFLAKDLGQTEHGNRLTTSTDPDETEEDFLRLDFFAAVDLREEGGGNLATLSCASACTRTSSFASCRGGEVDRDSGVSFTNPATAAVAERSSGWLRLGEENLIGKFNVSTV
jgi:hypothetical protein